MDFLPSFAPWQWALIAGAGVFVAFLQWPNISGAAGKVKSAISGATKTSGDVPARREVLDYLDGCYSFFESVKCKEGMAAITTAVTHAFHEHDAQGNVIEGGK